jgi:chromate reductase, NAD(P)H dehydrogenase (quinone)
MQPRILAFAGSLRRESFNKKLATIAVSGARKAGAEVTLINLEDLPLPLFDQDLESEQGMPKNGATLKKLFIDHEGLMIAAPEYNSSITAALKNALDWVSRPAPGEPFPLMAFRGKVAILMSASPGGLGGLRGLVHVRSILNNIGVIVLPDQVGVSAAHQAFRPDGSLADSKQQADVEALGKTLASFLTKFKA